MGRQPRRASGVKALQAIKETSQTNRTKATAKVSHVSNMAAINSNMFTVCSNPAISFLFFSQKYQSISENASSQPAGVKRSSSPGSIMLPSAKRNALGDVTNNVMRYLKNFCPPSNWSMQTPIMFLQDIPFRRHVYVFQGSFFLCCLVFVLVGCNESSATSRQASWCQKVKEWETDTTTCSSQEDLDGSGGSEQKVDQCPYEGQVQGGGTETGKAATAAHQHHNSQTTPKDWPQWISGTITI